MPNTYSQIYVQLVFTVYKRQSLLPKNHRDDLQKYMTGIVQNRKNKMLAIFCMPDHTHILIGLNPDHSISYLVRDIKASSSKYINENKWIMGQFKWQQGFGCFSYSRNQIDRVIKYILNQDEHHNTMNFQDEYINLLNEFGIDYKDEYLFEWVL